ncbi:MAG TPA: proline dehydrogenase family protein [Thermomicrobiaceae bacterium]|nr:proline dehydrogenase family protein [Thermomicrobiaceae bacterium]
MLRSAMLALAGNDWVSERVTHANLSRDLALRFVAGDTFEEAAEVVRRLNRRGVTVTLDKLGENVASAEAATAASSEYRAILQRIKAEGIDSAISVKLTMLGLDIDEQLCRANLRPILETAAELDSFVRIDMEGSAYTARTLAIFYDLHAEFGDHVGIVLQSYLYRTEQDVQTAIERGARVRLVKGAYLEPPSVAYPRKPDVDAAYRREMEQLLEHGTYPAIATHDEAIIRVARGFTQRLGIGTDRFEFQMLYGIRRDLQRQLTGDGYHLRIYVPFGAQWYPYFMRRMAERPANLLFVLRNLTRR